MNTKYRGLYFLGATIAIGLLIIAVMRLMNNTTVGTSAVPISISGDNMHKVIEEKIAQLDLQRVDPSLYNTLLIEINTAANQGLYNEDIKQMLVNNLNQHYKALALQKVNGYVSVDPLNYTEVEKFLAHLDGVLGAASETKEIKSKIKTIQYYTNTLPNKVNTFINEGYGGFEDPVYQSLLKELNSVPENIKSRKFVNSNLSGTKNKLVQHRADFINWDMNVNNTSYP